MSGWHFFLRGLFVAIIGEIQSNKLRFNNTDFTNSFFFLNEFYSFKRVYQLDVEYPNTKNVETHIIFQTSRWKLASILMFHASSTTIKLIFFIICVDIRQYCHENDTTCDTNLSHAECAFEWVTFFFARSICRYYWRNTLKQTLSLQYCHSVTIFFWLFL